MNFVPAVLSALVLFAPQQDVDIPRLVRVADNVYSYEDFHPSPEKFTTNSLVVVTRGGVLVADGQASTAATQAMIDAIKKITRAPIMYVVIASDHGDHTGGNAAFPASAKYLIHPTSQAMLNGPAGAVLVTGNATVPLGPKKIDAPAQANWGEYAAWKLAASQGPIAIRKVYAELTKK